MLRNIFYCILLGLAVHLAFCFPSLRINSSVLSLLPQEKNSIVPREIEEGFLDRLDEQLIFLVAVDKDCSREERKTLIQSFTHDLQSLEGINSVTTGLSEAEQEVYGKEFYAAKTALIDPQIRARLSSESDLSDYVLSQLYLAGSQLSSDELLNDPLLLTRQLQFNLMTSTASQLKLVDGLLQREYEGKIYFFIHATSSTSSFNMQHAHAMVERLNQLIEHYQSSYQVTIYKKGALFYSDFAASRAQADMAQLGPLSLALVLGIMLFFFLSLRPLVLALCSISIGAMAALSLLCFFTSEIYLITALLSLSVVGLSVDYTIYFVTERKLGQKDTATTLKAIRKPLLQGVTLTVFSYLALALAPFPAITQMAFLGACGLAFACATVFFIHPFLMTKTQPLPQKYLHFLMHLQERLLRWKKPRLVLMIFIVGAALICLPSLQVQHDIKALQDLPEELTAHEAMISTVTGQKMEMSFFVLFAEDEQTLLERNEKLWTDLSAAHIKAQRFLLNSLQQQAQDAKLFRQAQEKLAPLLQSMGLNIPQHDYGTSAFTLDDFLQSKLSLAYQLLFMKSDHYVSLMIPLFSSEQKAQLKEIADTYEDVALVDRRHDISMLFASYAQILSWLIAALLCLLTAFLWWRLGWKDGLRSVLPTVCSLLGALVVLTLSGGFLNLFVILALILVVGIGINYTFFFLNKESSRHTALFATTAAVLTSVATFSVLLLSYTKAISLFGIVLVSGVIIAYLLAPFVRKE